MPINIAEGSLTIVGANTSTPQVFWNGVLVENVVSVRVSNDVNEQRVVITVPEQDATLASMQSSGVIIRREVQNG